MRKKLSSTIFLLLFAACVWAQSDTTPFLLDRQIVSRPELPPEAANTALRGLVRVPVTVDVHGNVIAVGKALGPGPICARVTRADVVAVRNAVAEAAKLVKYAPAKEGEPAFAKTWFGIELRGAEEVKDDLIPIQVAPTASAERNSQSKPRDPNKFTVKGDVNYSAANAPPPDYKGPVAAPKDQGATDKGEKYTLVPDANYSAAAAVPTESDSSPGGKMLSGGVLNGKAVSLPKPPYPPAARAVRATGAVSIQVLIDENGEVFSAQAVSGHPLLRPAAVTAACNSGFSPTLLEGNPVRVSGIITYNFVP